MSKLVLKLDGKNVRLNPYKRITRGTEVVCFVDGEENTAVVDNAGKYTYLNVRGVDCYLTGVLTEGGVYDVAEWVPTAPKAKAEPKLDEEGNPVPKKTRRSKKAEVAAE